MAEMAVKKPSVSLEQSVADDVADAAKHDGLNFPAWLDKTTEGERALIIEEGLKAVREYEEEYGPLSEAHLAWAKAVLDGSIREQES